MMLLPCCERKKHTPTDHGRCFHCGFKIVLLSSASLTVPVTLHLDDFTPTELAQIARQAAEERFGMRFEEGLEALLAKHIELAHAAEIPTHNGGLAVQLVEAALGRLATRLSGGAMALPVAGTLTLCAEQGSVMRMLTAADFHIEREVVLADEMEKEQVDAEVAALVGMGKAKEFLRGMRTRVLFVQAGGPPELLKTCMNIVITGNPGTGKTTFARLLFRFLRAHGVLRRDAFVEKNALERKGQYVGQTTPQVKEAVKEAMGGCLFLDEAYALTACDSRGADSFSNEAVRTLLTEVENNRTNLLVVLAGYKDKMKTLMRADPGLPRRFPVTLHLDDYSPAELAQIAHKAAEERFGMRFEGGLEALLAKHIELEHAADIATHNGGLAIQLVEAAMGRLATRLCGAAATVECMHTLTASDFNTHVCREDTAQVGARAAHGIRVTTSEDYAAVYKAAALKARMAAQTLHAAEHTPRLRITEGGFLTRSAAPSPCGGLDIITRISSAPTRMGRLISPAA